VSYYAPGNIVTSREVERVVNSGRAFLPDNIIHKQFGVSERRFAGESVQASDLAVGAARKILERIDPRRIDCLIFAAGSSDLIEPATANIIQSKLGLSCPALDIKNACNSFVSGLQVADAFVVSRQYTNVLVVTGEKLSTIIKINPDDRKDLSKRLACLSMGDGGAAALVTASNDESGILAQTFFTRGDYWHLCTVLGGGTMHPHDATKVYFEGKTKELRSIFLAKKARIVEECLEKVGWNINDIDHFFMHHVSASTFELVAKSFGVDPGKFFNVMEHHGNMAAASIPFAMSKAIECGRLRRGDKMMLIGVASGISISIQLVVW
jgi:acyl-CoA:acyl-CoA alkyltransferase